MTEKRAAEPIEEQIALELVAANRILFAQGIVDAFGHVSVRDPLRKDRFLLSRNKAPALVDVDDIMRFDFDGHAEIDDRKPYLERFIHGEIYRARPDVMAVVHSHSPEIVPFTIVDVPFRPVCHMCGFISGQTPVFEIRDHAGPASNMLICDSPLGSKLARCIGESSLVLMRGHGVTVVGGTLRQAVFRSVYTEMNARLQSQAMRLSSNVVYLTEHEAAAAAASNDSQIDRAWDFWKQEIQR